jgi:hypothetical protein
MQSLHADNDEQQGKLQFEEWECLRDRQNSLERKDYSGMKTDDRRQDPNLTNKKVTIKQT